MNLLLQPQQLPRSSVVSIFNLLDRYFQIISLYLRNRVDEFHQAELGPKANRYPDLRPPETQRLKAMTTR